jgi:hypothetical protein
MANLSKAINTTYIGMYVNEDETLAEMPIIGRKVRLVRWSVTSGLGIKFDYPFRFNDAAAEYGVYIPDGIILLTDDLNLYKVKVEPNEDVERASAFGLHKNALSLESITDEDKADAEFFIGKLFTVTGRDFNESDYSYS